MRNVLISATCAAVLTIGTAFSGVAQAAPCQPVAAKASGEALPASERHASLSDVPTGERHASLSDVPTGERHASLSDVPTGERHASADACN